MTCKTLLQKLCTFCDKKKVDIILLLKNLLLKNLNFKERGAQKPQILRQKIKIMTTNSNNISGHCHIVIDTD